MKTDQIRNVLLTVGMVLCANGTMPTAASSASNSGNQNATVVYPPESQLFGRSYAEWTAAWWQWAASMPTSNHPLFDSGSCDAGQRGPVWFLGGAFTGITTTRDCTVPPGKSILFPALNVECSNVEPPPFFGSNEAELRDCAHTFMGYVAASFATLDGQPLPMSHVESPLYEFTAVPGSLFGNTDPLTGISVSDGLWVFLGRLSGGRHTLRLGGRFDFPDGSSFPIDVTYNLTVRGHRGDDMISSEPGDTADASWGVVKQLFR